ncbi:hypothetical protein D3C79_756530 [compost metagenome]
MIQRRRGAYGAALADQGQGVFATAQGMAGQRQATLGAIQGQVSLADLGDQGNVCSAADFLGCQILLERCVAQAFHAAEQVDFVLRQRQPYLISAVDAFAAIAGEVRRQVLAIARSAGVQPRHAIGTTDAI